MSAGGLQAGAAPDKGNLEEHKEHFAASIPAFAGRGLRVKSVNPPPKATVRVPGSKSFTNRAAVLAGMCPRPVTLEGVLLSDDSWWALASLERLGFRIDLCPSSGNVHVEPPSRRMGDVGPIPLYFGMAGTLARFFPAVVLNFETTFPALGPLAVNAGGAPRLCDRPLSELVAALRSLGGRISSDKLPCIIESGSLAGQCFISGKTSGQFLSGLLLAAAGARAPIFIDRVDDLVQPDYVRMTVQALNAFGGRVEHDDELREFHVECPSGLAAERFAIEADASTACYFMAFAAIFDIELVLENIGSSSLQPDLGFAQFLGRLGARVSVEPGRVVVSSRGTGPAGRDANSAFKGGIHADFSACSDQALTAAVLALFADGPVHIHGVEHIRKHESDRVASLVANMRALGVSCDEFPDGFRVTPPAPGTLLSGTWDTHHDHRFGMTGFLLAARHGDVEILSPGCVEKTAPDFFARMGELGVEYR